MGLDMYLNKFPRTTCLSVHDLDTVIGIHTAVTLLSENKTENIHFPSSFANTHFTPEQVTAATKLINAASISYYDWDDAHNYPQSSIVTEVGYWRKANAVHDYFVQHVQDGVDDCKYHNEVTKEILTDLRDRCRRIIESTVMISAKIRNGQHFNFDSQAWEDVMEDGRAVINPDVCEQELPTRGGFFFGSTDYDEYYMEDIVDTFELCERLLKETDFNNEMLFYVSSW